MPMLRPRKLTLNVELRNPLRHTRNATKNTTCNGYRGAHCKPEFYDEGSSTNSSLPKVPMMFLIWCDALASSNIF